MTKTASILCITSEDDAHLPFVRPHLSSELTVISPKSISGGVGLSILFEDRQNKIIYNGRTISRVKSVWYRKPQIYQDDLPVPKEFKRYSLTALRNHANSLYSLFPDAFWLSDYYSIQHAGSKPRQLEVARSLGFHIPATLATSDPGAAAAFLKKHGEVVVKKQATWLPVHEVGYLDFPTTIIKKGQKVNLAGLHLAPAIFQQSIAVDFELRVTVVGEKVFAASIRDEGDTTQPEAVRDWRFGYSEGATKFEPHEISSSLEEKCVKLVKAFGLFYGAIDLIVDKKGKTWFLEINPNGQWAFIEEDTGLPIGKAIAQLLEGGGR
jgi:hypothetical protein